MRDKQRVFIAEYLKDFNATQAAIRAGYSASSARFIGHENLTKPYIAEEIKTAIDERAMTEAEILLRLSDFARGDIASLMDITPAGYTFKLMVEDDDGNKTVNPNTKLIKKIKQKVTTILAKSETGEDKEIVESELELYDAKASLDSLAKIRGMFVDKTEVSARIENTILEVRPIDYRTGLAALAPGSISDSDTSSEGENSLDGEKVG